MRKMVWVLLLVVPALIGGVITAAVLLTPLPEPDNPEVTEIVDSSGRLISQIFTENRIELPMSRIPKTLLNAIVAVEDDRFYKHNGIDPIGIARAMVRNIRAGEIREGGSTLTQQLARNLRFNGERLGLQRTWTRKLKEALLTLKIEYKYSKEQILGMYWNTIYLGRGSYGLERAAQNYFGKSGLDQGTDGPINLTLSEVAVLAALPQAPEYYSQDSPEAQSALLKRRDIVLDKMAEQGYITAAEAVEAKSQTIALLPPKRNKTGPDVRYFEEYVMDELDRRFPDVAALIDQGGYRITTTIDQDLQGAANTVIENAQFPYELDPGASPELALVAIDPSNGYIRALVERRVSKNGGRWTLEPQQPGSTFKPVVYATALQHGYKVTDTQVDEIRQYPGSRPDEPWEPHNFDERYTNKPETMRTALRKSLNTVTAAWMDVLKPAPVIDMATAMGIERDRFRGHQDLTVGLGTAETPPIEMVAAYAPLANGGMRVKPMAVLKVEDRDGNVYVEQRPTQNRALSPGVAFIVTEMLKEVVRPGGTAGGVADMVGWRPVAGKSGTTDNSQDAWFVGYSPTLIAGVWAGYPEPRESNLLGGRDVSPIWGSFMAKALAGSPWKDWTPPPDVVKVEICTITHKLPNASCPTGTEWYLSGNAPTEVDETVHWEQVVPRLPGVPWAPTGLLPPLFETEPPEPPDASPALEDQLPGTIR